NMSSPKHQSSHYKPPSPPSSQILSMVAIPVTSMLPPPLPTEVRRRSTRQRRLPSRPDSNPSDSSASQTSSQRERKRKRDASQPRRSASVSTHSASAASASAFSRAKSLELGLQKDDNGLPLCPNCHFQYDKPGTPGWVFFPADLKYFIEEEKKDVRRRKQSWREDGQVHCRIPLTAMGYFEDQERKGKLLPGARAGTYLAYVIASFGPEGRAFMVGYNIKKAWHGDPMAALNKAFRGLTAGYLVLPTDLITLHRLYQDNDLQIQQLQKTPLTEHGDGGDPDNDDQEQRSEETSSSSEGEQPHQRRPSTTRQPCQSLRVMKLQERASGSERRILGPEQDEPLLMLATSRKPRAVLQEEPFARSYPSKIVKVQERCWEIGPATTAQEIIDFYSFFHGGEYVDNGPWAVAYPVDDKGKGTTMEKYGLLSPRASDKPGENGRLCEVSKPS
ncbi:MAG: hypothetical protein Q9184_008359, partial [Pyrenodesmia sp. 2 TL-2023]